MTTLHEPDLICRLKELRIKKKITQAQLADLVGIQRQAVYDVETGRYLPNTAVALRLARILGCRVEDIFLENRQDTHPVVMVDRQDQAGPRVSIAKIRNKLYAYPLSGANSITEEMRAADGLLEPGHETATLLKSHEQIENTALLLGCDPAFSLLRQYVLKNKTEAGLHCRFASSQTALTQLDHGRAHIAGIHMHDTGDMDGNQELARQLLKGFKGLIVAFAIFEEGLMVTRKNPFNIQKPCDLARKKIRLANREKGAALRSLLDDCLCRENIPFSAVTGYDDLVASHSQGAQRVLYGTCDAALGLRSVADAFNLDFVPITTVRCDLVIPQDFLTHAGVGMALDTLQKSTFRNELNCLPGYDASCTGNIITRLDPAPNP
ncbi:MAG: substrate-binding domain-containing protein [Pseudomonadota bacterium]